MALDFNGALEVVDRLKRVEGVEYCDAVQVHLRSIELAFRHYSFEKNVFENFFSYIRDWRRGRWEILSMNTSSFRELVASLPSASLIVSSRLTRAKLSEVKPVRGLFTVGDTKFPLESELRKLITAVCEEVKKTAGESCIVETIATQTVSERMLVNSEGSRAVEIKGIFEVLGYVMEGGHVCGFYVSCTNLRKLWELALKECRRALRRFLGLKKARRLNPFYARSRFPVILDYEVAGALIHEVAHFLEGDKAVLSGESPLGRTIGTEEITIINDPTIAWASGSYVFDDEGVLAKPVTLVEDGRVVNLLHTRWSASVFGDRPQGCARGLSTPPKAMQSNLVLKPGDWSVNEMIEDTRRGFLVEGVVKAELWPEGIISIEPEIAWFVERGEIVQPVKVKRIFVKLSECLKTVDAIGRRLGYRSSIEKGFNVSELAPYIRLSYAYIE